MQAVRNGLYRLFFVLAATVASGCSDHSEPALSGEPKQSELGTVTQELSGGVTHETCDTRPADLVWTGGGFVRTDANYTKHNGTNQCWDAFLLDLNNYHPKFSGGTRVTYGRVVPRDEATCKRTSVKGHFWRKNSNGTTTYLGSASSKGRWITGSTTPARCDVANFVIERVLPDYKPGASYRLALTAREDRATTGYDRREIVIQTQQPDIFQSDHKLYKRLTRLLSEANTHASRGTVHPAVQKYFNRRGTTASAMECRAARLELSGLRISQTSLAQAGAGTTGAADFVNTYDTMVQSFCGSGALTALAYQGQLIQHLAAFQQMRLVISTLHGMPDASTGELISSIVGQDFSRIMAGCGTDTAELHDFIRTGTAPAGITGPDVLLRNCAGSASTVQTRLGMTGSSAAIRASIKSCIVDAFDEPAVEQQAGTCSDPRASGGSDCHGDCPETVPADNPCLADPYSRACFERRVSDTGFPSYIDDEVGKEILARWVALNTYNEAKHNYTLAVDQLNDLTIRAAEYNTIGFAADAIGEGTSQASGVARGVEEIIGTEPATSDYLSGFSKLFTLGAKLSWWGAASTVEDATRLQQSIGPLQQRMERALRALCRLDPTHEDCAQIQNPPPDPAKRCPEHDLGTGPVWFDHPNGSRISVADRIQSCTCEAMRRATFTLTGGGTSNLFCMTEEERRALDCQTNPWDEDDGSPNPLLRPECRNAFQPSGLDRDSLLAGLCDVTRCADDQFAVAAFGRCVCVDNPTTSNLATVCNFNGPAGRLDCGPTGGLLVCDALGPRCVDEGAGRKPFGNNPFCQLRGQTIQLGARPAWAESTVDSFFTGLTRVNNTTRQGFFMMKRGFQMLAGPSNFEQTYKEVGSDIVFEVNQPSTLPADKGSMQGYCSNEEAGIHNVFLGQFELRAGLNIARFPFDGRCWGDGTTPMTVGASVRTATNQADPAVFLGYYFGGNIRNVDNPFETCDDGPDPAPPLLDPGLLVDIINGNVRPGIIQGTWTRDVTFASSSLDALLVPVDRAIFFQ